jgi:transposase, IS30 family
MKKSSYSHLTVEERDKISVLKAEGQSLRRIAHELGRHHTTIARELDRNAPPVRKGRYLSHKAHERSVERKSLAHQRDRLKNKKIQRYVENGLSIHWSPEQIAGRLPIDFKGQSISHEAIYQYLYKERHDLVTSLPDIIRNDGKGGTAENIASLIFLTGYQLKNVPNSSRNAGKQGIGRELPLSAEPVKPAWT